MLRLNKLSPEELEAQLRAEGEELREELRQADCNATWLFARNSAIMAEDEAEEADFD